MVERFFYNAKTQTEEQTTSMPGDAGGVLEDARQSRPRTRWYKMLMDAKW